MENSFPGASGARSNREESPENERKDIKWVDIREASRCLNISEKTIRRRIKAGKVRSQKISGAWFIALEDHPKLYDIPSPSPPSPPPPAAPPPSAEKLDEIKETARYILKRLDEVDKKLYVLAEEREHVIASSSMSIRKMEQTIERLSEENIKLKKKLEMAELDEDGRRAERFRGGDDALPSADEKTGAILPKPETDDTLELKAMLASNERGLSLLREEIRKKDKLLQQKEHEIVSLENELRMLKVKPA